MIAIRKAIKSDYIELMTLYNSFVGDDRFLNHDNDSFEKVLGNPTNYIYVAVDKEIIVGFATFSVRNVVRYPRPIAELDELFVVEVCRKQGIGKLLLKQVEEEATNQQCYRIFIESHFDHKSAHILYNNLGYTNYGYHYIKNL